MSGGWKTGVVVGLGLWAGLVTGCGTLPRQTYQPSPPRPVEGEFDQVWAMAVRTLTERGYRILSADCAAGTIETEWRPMNPAYAATVFVTRSEDRYSDCGKPRLGLAYRGKDVRVHIQLSPLKADEVALQVQAMFQTQRVSNFLFWAGGPAGEAMCASRVRLEEELALEIRLRVLGERLERLRRKTP